MPPMSAAHEPPDTPGLDTEALLAAVRALHEDIRARSGALLERARREEAPELASRVGAQGAGDVGYAIDEAAEAALEAFGTQLGARQELTLISEGPGMRRYAPEPGAALPRAQERPALRAIIDPIDGTRSLMHDMRSAWALTGLARDRGEATRLSDVELAVQTELPTTLAGTYRVLWAQRGAGAWIARHDARSGAELDRRPLRARPESRIENGYLCFTRFLPVERRLVAELESRYLERIIAEHRLQPRLLYDDQYLCTAGQLHLVTTGRYRLLADLRGWLHRTRGLANFCSKPYDLAALLVYREAGVPVLDEHFQPLDAPLDTETRLSVIAFANEALRAQLEPQLRAVMEELQGRPGS
jgi:fructose-1,6-bisphosphatase/inositol monophosphatase family enzyme